MSPWTGFEESDGRDQPLEADPYLSIHGDIESQCLAVCQAGHELPQEAEDPHYFGPEFNTYHRCYHGHIPVRKVAFDMAATGRRFIGCPRKGRRRCQFVIWIDEPWNPVLTRALINLWMMAGEHFTDIYIHDSSVERNNPEYAIHQHVTEASYISSAACIVSSRPFGFEANMVVAAFSVVLSMCASLLLVVLFM